MKIDDVLYNKILQEIEAGYINVQQHPSLPLRIFNYSKSTQFDWRWNEATSICRGLILDDQNEIVSRPFEKFFTYEQCQKMEIAIPNVPFKVFEKLDGSLGVMYVYGDYVGIATRGSFVSDQAILANKILEKYPNEADWFREMAKAQGYTFLFEIVGPDNRIVISYEENDLILLACIDKNGKDVDIDNYWFNWPIKAKRYKQFESESFEMMKGQNLENEEGYVALFENDFRMKIKFENYLELHKMYCGLSNRMIWEHISNGGMVKDLDIPDELMDWALDVEKNILDEALEYTEDIHYVYEEIPKGLDRKTFAEYAKMTKYPSFMFLLYDGRNITQGIWNLVYPKESVRFNSLN
jgi:T4 RnlA family RNA ligase